MKKPMIIGLCLALAAGISTLGAAEIKQADLDKTLNDSAASAKIKMEAIENYVSHVEKMASDLTRQKETLTADAVKKVTAENWQKKHAYFKGDDLKRMKLYPKEGSTKTEDFYFYQDQPIFIFVEKNGVGKEYHDENATGEKYFFADGKLIAAMSSEGQSMDLQSEEATRMSSKLHKEANGFRGMLK